MLQPDSSKLEFNPDNVIGNNNAINNDMITEIEKELQDNSYDIISLVFLLYDVPDTALQRLIVYQRVSKDIGNSTNLNMLHEWFRHAKNTPLWKHEFIEALLLCQLYGIVRKIGIDVKSARSHYQIDNTRTSMYINPAKKALYKLCENINSENMLKLKKALLTYKIDTTEYDSCELIFLKLMCDKFININQLQYNKKTYGFQVELDKLIKIIENLPGLGKFAHDLMTLQHSINGESRSNAENAFQTPTHDILNIAVDECTQGQTSRQFYNIDFEDEMNMFTGLSLDDTNITLQSDRSMLANDSFEIKNRQKLGVCVILNQVNFYPSKNSIENDNHPNLLSRRIGSDRDTDVIEHTMRALNFTVFNFTDLNHQDMFKYLKKVIINEVSKEDSVFVLCILSHGVRGHVYASDSVKVNMDDFQNLLDSDIAVHLHGKPKLFIIQACQDAETPCRTLVADSPEGNYTLKKTNFLIYWATAPELNAYRDVSNGSIFIQWLCRIILENADKDHICDIFTKATDRVTLICEELGCVQVPIYHSTLRKKLYLRKPK